jgi:hypothetical protein
MIRQLAQSRGIRRHSKFSDEEENTTSQRIGILSALRIASRHINKASLKKQRGPL